MPRARDIRPDPAAIVSPGDWSEHPDSLEQLFRRAESYALAACDWYLADKALKRRVCQILRVAMILLGLIGGLIPLLVVADVTAISAGWGYIFLAVAAGCAALDRFFGLTSAWMRDVRAAQAIQCLLIDYQFDWACLVSSRDATREMLSMKLELIGRFSRQVQQVIVEETASWSTEFSAAGEELISQSIAGMKNR